MTEISIPNFSQWRHSTDGPLHLVFILHLWLSSWSMLGYWSGNKLLIQDVFLLLCLMWSIHDRVNQSPVLLALVIDMLSVMLDVIILSIYFPSNNGATEKFSAVMAIFNLIFRVVSVVLIYKCWQARSDTGDGNLPQPPNPPSSVISTVSNAPKHYNGQPTYGYPTSYQNSPAALTGPRQDVPQVPPGYTQHT